MSSSSHAKRLTHGDSTHPCPNTHTRTHRITSHRITSQTKMSAEEEAAEAEMKKLKSVQSARDCRRRKKAFIQSLQVRVKECEDREVATQARIAALEVELKQLQAARGDLHPTSQAEATIIETLNASDEMGANLNEILG
eukprot:m.55050 g.55050  ORF g.55050 m.55050 type:complete len:139 (+) comp7579_c0_seq1:181-597(+)